MTNKKLETLIKSINRLQQSIQKMERQRAMYDILDMIKRRPGWTTPAEFLAVKTMVDNLDNQVKIMIKTMEQTRKIADLVGKK